MIRMFIAFGAAIVLVIVFYILQARAKRLIEELQEIKKRHRGGKIWAWTKHLATCFIAGFTGDIVAILKGVSSCFEICDKLEEIDDEIAAEAYPVVVQLRSTAVWMRIILLTAIASALLGIVFIFI